MAGHTDPPRDPDLPARFHKHPSGTENHDANAVHPLRPAGTPPPPKANHQIRNRIVAGVGGILALAVILGVIAFTAGGTDSNTSEAAPSSTFGLPPKPEFCTEGVPGERIPRAGMDLGDVLVARKAMPAGWKFTDEALPMATRAQVVSAPADSAPAAPSSASPPSASPSSPPAPIIRGTTPAFGLLTLPEDAGKDLRASGESFLRCLIYIPRYAGLEPLPAVVTSSQEDVTDNGVKYAHLAARITTGTGDDRGGDAIYLVVIGTKPTTVVVGIAPLGDEKHQKQIQEALTKVQIRAPQ